jgi:L-ribulose-5-phosphate 3-epimerase
MFPAVNAWTFPNSSPEEQIAAAAQAGFRGLELVVGDEDPLRPDTPPARFAELAAIAEAADISLVSVASALFWKYNYGAADEADRARAKELTLRLLDQAVAARADAILVVPAVVGQAGAVRPLVSYADAFNRTLAALDELRYEAEARAVTIAIENVWNRFLLSPLEAADLIDRINSPYVGWYFDTGNVVAHGYPEDWIATLAGRIARVHLKDYDLSKPGFAGFCELGTGSVNWPAVIDALRKVRYEGPLTFEGPATDPTAVCGTIARMLAAARTDG